MKQVLLLGGRAVVEEVPAPGVSDRNILVRVHYSCISVGTELAGMRAMEPLYKRALKQPEKVVRGLHMIREQGLSRTVNHIRGMTACGQPTGYSAAGEVIAIGSLVNSFAIGDRVACAGANIANHAEIIDVPINLAVRLPDDVSFDEASTVTIGAIALQGIRRLAPTLAETVVVIGLGILGQLTVQMLKANGCRVLGIDLDSSRIATAILSGVEIGMNAADEGIVERIHWLTEGMGADAVVVTAAAPSDHHVISQAMHICRKKGRVVLVGDVGLNLKREDFYRKELDFYISTSYGPGRYDPYYEEGGQDYPLPYVRWTEQRNMGAYLALLADRKINLQVLKPKVLTINDASKAYELLCSEKETLLVLLQYPMRESSTYRSVKVQSATTQSQKSKLGVALIGAGNFAQSTHLPNLLTLSDSNNLRWIVSRTGSNAYSVAKRYNVPMAGTDYDAVLSSPDVDLVIITTRHDLHASMTLQALEAGKHVFVEKPLALNEVELTQIENFYANGICQKPLLMTGFNRRFSPLIEQIVSILKHRFGPMMISYRMNAGAIPADSWVHAAEGGGRNIGEACHVYDLFALLTGATPVSVKASALGNLPAGFRSNENFNAVITYSDGSVCSLLYSSLGSKKHSKECMDIYCDQQVISLDNYRSVSYVGSQSKEWINRTTDKGHMEELRQLLHSLKHTGDWPISLLDQVNATRVALEVEQALSFMD